MVVLTQDLIKQLPDLGYIGKKNKVTIKAAEPFDPSKDYTKALDPADIKHEGKSSFVFLRGLEKLARARGIVSAQCIRLDPLQYTFDDGRSIIGGVICTYQYTFVDGGVYQGSADATLKNCEGDFKLYLTAMAESRAKARALRTAFGIGMCSWEEKADVTIKTDRDIGPIDDGQLILLRKFATQYELSKGDLLEMLDVPHNVAKMADLSKEEGRELIVKLNKYKKPKEKKRVAKKKV